MNEPFEPVDVDDEELDFAIRKRMQSISIFHRIGGSIDGIDAFRFKAAGTFDSALTRENPPDTAELISDASHIRRIGKEDGTLIFVKDPVDDGKAGVIDLADHILEPDDQIRHAALKALDRIKGQMLPQTAAKFSDHKEAISSNNEKQRLHSGLLVHDALNNDYWLNLIGLRKCIEFQFDDYDKFYRRVFRPSVQSLNAFAPQLVDQIPQLNSWFAERKGMDLVSTIQEFNTKWGYLPPSNVISVLSLIDKAGSEKTNKALAKSLWKMVGMTNEYKVKYYAALLFSDNPQLVTTKTVEDFESLIAEQITVAKLNQESEKFSRWDAFYKLTQHFVAHLESSIPAVDSQVTVSFACWLAEQAVSRFFFYNGRMFSITKKVINEELNHSSQKWSVSRSYSNPSTLRKDTISTSSIWSDSLISVIVKNWKAWRKHVSNDFRQNVLVALNNIMVLNRFNSAEDDSISYLVDDVPFDLIRDIAKDCGANEESDGLAQLVTVSETLNQVEGVRKLLADFVSDDPKVGFVVGFALQARQFAGSDAGTVPVEFLRDSTWREAAFLRSTDSNLALLAAFLGEWQLARRNEWRVRLAHIFASLAETCDDQNRKAFLFELCLRSSINIDISSPIERLLSSEQKSEFLNFAKLWEDRLNYIADNSVPWVAYRIRGFLARIQQSLHLDTS